MSNRKSTSYVMTVSDRNDPTVINLKRALYMSGKRVHLKGRGAKVPNNKGYQYDRFGNVVGGLENAKRFDVYVYDDYDFQREREKEMRIMWLRRQGINVNSRGEIVLRKVI